MDKGQQIPLLEVMVVPAAVDQMVAAQELETPHQHLHHKEIMAELAEVQMALAVVVAEPVL